MSSYTDFTINCCGKNFSAERFRLSKPYLKDVVIEEYKIIECPICLSTIIERKRVCKAKSGQLKIFNKRLSGWSAKSYLQDLNQNNISLITQYNNEVEKGSKEDYNWFYGYMNRRYDLNDKCREILAIE